MQCKDLCERIEQLIGVENEMLNNKTRLLCEHCLSFGKEYIDNLDGSLYEECKRFIKMEDYKKDLKFGIEAIKICEEILVYIGELDEMVKEKAKAYCKYFLSYNLDGVECSKLKERCRKYLDDYQEIDMRNMRIKNL